MKIITADMKVGDRPAAETIEETYKQFTSRLADFKKYSEYYEGRHEFKDRKGAKVTVNLVRYGIDNLVAYMAGIPPKYSFKEGDGAAGSIVERYDRQNLKEKEAEIVRSLKIYGRAYELVYHDPEEDGHPPRSVFTSPECSYVVYDQRTDPDSVFGAIVREIKQDKKKITVMDVYGPGWYQEWRTDDSKKWTLSQPVKGGDTTRFTRVPLIEYLNSEDAMSEVENVISLQDALNAVMSDRQDDKDAFAGAMLLLYGTTLGLTKQEIKDNRETLKDTKALHFESRQQEGAEYLIKQMDEAGAQTYTDTITSTIHKLMRVPDFSDEQFSSNSSGVAMAYKLYGTHQAAKVTEQYFGRGFRRRCKLYDDGLENAAQDAVRETSADVSKMSIVFNYNVVVDPQAEAQAAQGYLAAGVSQETVLENISIVNDVGEELKRLAKQKDEDLSREKQMMRDEFGNPPTAEKEVPVEE